jgi:alpha-L-rhamnosidase
MVAYYNKIGYYDTGIFGTDLVTRMLFEHGDGEVAVKLLTSLHTHSYGEMRRRGATTIWEYWPESLRDRSRNHPMFGAVVAYFYEYLLGIGQGKGSAGYEELEIAPVTVPQIDGIRGYRTLPGGRVSVAYERRGASVEFILHIPAGQKATFLYEGERYPLNAGENRFLL